MRTKSRMLWGGLALLVIVLAVAAFVFAAPKTGITPQGTGARTMLQKAAASARDLYDRIAIGVGLKAPGLGNSDPAPVEGAVSAITEKSITIEGAVVHLDAHTSYERRVFHTTLPTAQNGLANPEITYTTEPIAAANVAAGMQVQVYANSQGVAELVAVLVGSATSTPGVQ